MKKNLIVVAALISLIVGVAIGYQIGKKPAKEEKQQISTDVGKKIQKKDYTLNGMLAQLSDDADKSLSNKSFSLSVRILGSHQICQDDYDAYKLAFWTDTPAEVEQELAVDVKKDILDVVNASPCGFFSFVAFNPTGEKKMTDVVPSCNAVHDVKTSCYPKSTFDYLYHLQQTFGYVVTMTKGIKTITVNGTTSNIRMIMFKIQNPITKTVAFYDIVDDPTSVIDPTGNSLPCPVP